ncbi:recombinase family protein [Chromatium okenii]|jgi:DNA invertase Pin-like site-specific DNA recombinase|uniref:Resolvase n=1 Tax=Chromatium okenii TaxID=61644 RepID=A0A2S7XMB0_9GAMM|nr:recombinase family protein [Chromatium okenii]PQJ94713.1 resolvase [Chromatium okenii]
MATYSYLRVSTQGQAESQAGLNAQLDACKAVAEIANTFADEGVSGVAGLDKRPGLLAAIDILKAGDTLIVAKRDRLGRDPIVVAMIERSIERKGARIQSAAGEGTDSDNPADVLMRRMVDAFAEYERLIIKSRTKAALKAKKERAERTGSVPYGYAVNPENPKELAVNETEQQAIEVIKELRSRGVSLQKIATHLQLSGFKSRSKTCKWHKQTISNIFKFQPSQMMLNLRLAA